MKKQMSKRLLSWLLVTALLFTTMPVSFLTAYAEGIGDVITALTENTSEFLGGNGTEENPYLISTKVHLNNVRKYLDAHFKMVADIEFTEDDFAEGGDFYNEGQGWEPIGTDESSAFTGVFDGDGHTIAWLICHRNVYAGLFGWNTGDIKNLNMLETDISSLSASTSYAGGIVGVSSGSIDGCTNTAGNVKAVYAGGIVGYNNDGIIKNCVNTSSISNDSTRPSARIGGIAGHSYCYYRYGYRNRASISNCINTGNISTSFSSSTSSSYAYAGGIVGYNEYHFFGNYGQKFTVSNCINTGSIAALSSSSTDTYAGGIVGYNFRGHNDGHQNVIDSCYNIGSVMAVSSATVLGIWTNTYIHAGGIVGNNTDDSGGINSCYYLDVVQKGVGSGLDAAIGCTVEEMQKQETFKGFDFETVWEINEKEYYPFPTLQKMPGIEAKEDNTIEFFGGAGTPERPYLITNKTHLNNVRNYPDAHFKMMADIEFTDADFAEGGEFYNGGQGWIPIGEDEKNSFFGSFDGSGHSITGLVCYRTGSGGVYAGLFGNSSGYIQRVNMLDADISASSVNTSSSSHGAYTGGIAAVNRGIIEQCHISGGVSASASPYALAGGIAGYNSGRIANCFNIGCVSAFITSQSNDAEAYAGGIAGYTYLGTVHNCYNVGSVLGSSPPVADNIRAYFGGIAGARYSGDITNCFYLGITEKGVGRGLDTTVCCTVEEMHQQETFTGFDFVNIWKMDKDNAYPFPTLLKTPNTEPKEDNTTDFLGGIGTPDRPYLIATKVHLNNVRKYLGAHFKMMADIEFTDADFAEGGEFYNGGQGWEPIGAGDKQPFYGSFDGNDYTITGLVCQRSGPDGVYAGLFGYNGGRIERVHMLKTNISAFSSASSSLYAATYAGGITGINAGTIIDCTNGGSISSSASSSKHSPSCHTGGIAGYNRMGSIRHCNNTGSITAFATSIFYHLYVYSGGITGYNYDGFVANCYNNGTVSVPSAISYTDAQLGGIVGHNSKTISNCYNTGSVSALVYASSSATASYARAGGITGVNAGTISDCYNIESISASVSSISNVSSSCAWAGGIVGCNHRDINNCYNIGDVFASVSSAASSAYMGGIAGSDSGTLNNGYYLDTIPNGVGAGVDLALECTNEELMEVSTFLGFDFVNVWEIDNWKDYAYPQLKYNRQELIKSIEILSVPDNIQLIEGLLKKIEDTRVEITYEDGTTLITEITPQMLSELDMHKVGVQTIALTYGGKRTDDTVNIEVVEKSIEAIEVTKLPNKTTYIQGQPLNPTGGQLTVYYNNNTSKTLALGQAQLSYPDNSVGTVTVVVDYQGHTTNFTVTIKPKMLETITVENARPSYIEGQDIDKSQITVIATYNNGTSERVTDYDISGYTSTPGKKTITITYDGKTATFEVMVEAKSLTEIKVTKKPDKLTYLEGDDFDSTGMEVTAYYNNGTAEVVGDYQFSGYDSTPGTKKITISHGGKTTAFEVTVKAKTLVSIAVTKNPGKMTYIEGENLDTKGMELTLTYNNGAQEIVTTGWTETYDFSQPGQREVRIAYQGKKTILTVTVVAKTLTSIVISKEPNKMTYIEGDLFDPAGMIVVAYYNNGSEETVTDRVSITGYSSTPGIKTITVSYNEKSAQLSVTVEAKRAVSIEWETKPTKTTYYIGEALSLKGAVILIHYNNGTTEQESLENTSFGADQFNPNKLGEQVIYIRIDGAAEISFTVTVKSRVPDSITSGTYTVSGGTISKIRAGTTVSQLLNGINEKAYCKVYKGNSEVSGNTLVSTGMEVRLLDGSTVKSRVTVVVTGDTNGDGNITITDMLAVKSHLLKKSTLSGAAGKAADTSGDKTISITDFIQIKAHILGKDKIQPRSC